MLVFYLFAAVSLWLGVLSLKSGMAFARYVRQQLDAPWSDYIPAVSVIAPCRGIDQGFKENVVALLQQDYPHYEILFVADSAGDKAIEHVETARREMHDKQPGKVHLLVAGEAVDCGQKVHNLIHATRHLSAETEVIVFVDSDARPSSRWLRDLVAPLLDSNLGATTGYRWFVPVGGGLFSHLRSVWNASIASALGENRARNFCWGGSTAIRRSLFEKLKVRDYWYGSASDDFTLTRVLQQAKLPVHFVPLCLVPSFEDCSLSELLTFTNRQLQITRVYASHLWKSLFIGSLIFNLTFFGGIVLAIATVAAGQISVWVIGALILICALGAAKSFIRFLAVRAAFARQQYEMSSGLVAHLLLWPFGSLLQLINCIVAAMSRRIHWRGITYELKSPNETVIIARD